MPTMNIPFGEFLPSAPTFRNPGCVIADNVIPSAGGSYNPLAAPVAQGETLTNPVQGASQLFNNNRDSVIVGGTSTSLFVRTTTFNETTGLTPIGTGQFWDFAQYNNFVIATAPNNPPQYLDNINTDTTWSALPGSPPSASRCARVGDFLVLGNETNNRSRITWSSFNNPTASWAPDRLSQSGTATLPVHLGPVQRIIGGRYALVFQERGVIRLTYVGPPTVWRVDIVSEDRGATAPAAVVDVGYQQYFLAQDGFYVTNGSEFSPIGNDRVNNWFFENVDQASINETHGAVDWQNGAIVWSFRAANAQGFTRLLIYSWRYNRWSTASVGADWIVGSTLDGISIDELDAIYGNIDAIPISLDSNEFRAGDRRLAAFIQNASNQSEYSVFNGDPLAATWRTGEFEPAPAQRVFINEAYPLIESQEWDISCSVVARDNRGAVQASPPRVAGFSGFCAVRAEGQKVSMEMTKPAGGVWSRAQGLQINYQPAGMR